jgi:hypothetical protein
MLGNQKRRDFIDAVMYMAEAPSDKNAEVSLSNDFLFVHMIAGSPLA